MPRGVGAEKWSASPATRNATNAGTTTCGGGAAATPLAQNGQVALRGCDGPSGATGSGSTTESIERRWQCSTGPSDSSMRAEAVNGSSAAHAIARSARKAVRRRVMARIVAACYRACMHYAELTPPDALVPVLHCL